MKLKKKMSLSLTVLTALMSAVLFACSSEPKVNEFVNTADPQVELVNVDRNIQQAQNNQVDILSPVNFEAAKNSRYKAEKARSNNEDQKTVLHQIAVSQAYLDQATKVTDVAQQILQEPIAARKDALKAQSGIHFPKEMSAIDKKLRAITERIENNDTSIAKNESATLEKSYREIELNSIKKEKLGNAQSSIQQAIKEGAAKLTPETLDWANKNLAQNEAVITADRHNTVEVNKASASATLAGNRLMKMVRDAKNSTAKKPEDLAKQVEKNEMAAASSANQLNMVENDLAKTENKLDQTSRQNDQLQSAAWLDQEYEKATSEFTKDEAEVFKQGDKLLLRLKGLSFANNKSGIGSENFKLLAKVQKVIGDIGSSQIVVEGHTDSSGGKKLNEMLSTQRAESVQSYLIANKNISAEKIKAEGFGDTKPIATNKTAQGRAQNRRVDVIILAEPTTQKY